MIEFTLLEDEQLRTAAAAYPCGVCPDICPPDPWEDPWIIWSQPSIS
jgi:hypothetical protein